MKLLEYQGKSLLAQGGLATPDGAVASDAGEAATIAGALGGRVVIKAQIPAGKRGKSGAIQFADSPAQARAGRGGPAREADQRVHGERGARRAGVYRSPASCTPPSSTTRPARGRSSCSPSRAGWTSKRSTPAAPEKVLRLPIDIRTGLSQADAAALLSGTDLTDAEQTAVASALMCSVRGVPADRGRPG